MEKSILTNIGDSLPVYEIEQPNTKVEFKKFTFFAIVQRNVRHILSICLFTALLGLLIFLTDIKSLGIVLMSCAVVIPAFMIYACFISSLNYINKNKWYLQSVNTYKFFDEVIYIKSYSDEKCSESVITYASVFRLYETYGNYYIYISKNKSIIISKSNMKDINLKQFKRFIFDRIERSKLKNAFGLRLNINK